jgi:lysophospholipase L1-like esterase
MPGRRGTLLLSALCALAVALSAVSCSEDSGSSGSSNGITATPAEAGGLYLALGDSIAVGQGASDPATKGYVALVAEALRQQHGDSLEVMNLAVGGATTQDLIDEQLAPALEQLRTRSDVRALTITIGGNDLNEIQDSPDAAVCLADPLSEECPIPEVLAGTRDRLTRILSEILDITSPRTAVVIQLYPNLFSGTGHEFEYAASVAFDFLNVTINAVADLQASGVADPVAGFTGRGNELTNIPNTPPDFHPNDAGYRVIADAFLRTMALPVPAQATPTAPPATTPTPVP